MRSNAGGKHKFAKFENKIFRRGLFYDGSASDEEEGLLGEINLDEMQEEELWWSSASSESSFSQQSSLSSPPTSPASSPQPNDIGHPSN